MGCDLADVEEMNQKAKASIGLVVLAWQEFMEKESGLLVSIKMRENQVKISEEGRL